VRFRVWLVLAVALALLGSPWAWGSQSSGSAGIANVPPTVSGVAVNQSRTDDRFTVSFTVSDANTVADVSNVTVVIWAATSSFAAADDPAGHYTFLWNASGWSEVTLTGHLLAGTEPAAFGGASGGWTVNATFAEAAVVGNYTVRVTATDAGGATDYAEADVVRDKIALQGFIRDVAARRLYARMVYAYDGEAIAGGTVAYAGLTAATNSTGWATFSLSAASNFPWGTVLYGVNDTLYGISDTGLNQSVTLAKAGPRIIGGNATVQTATWNGITLEVAFNATTGTYETEVSGPKPGYILNATYDTDTDYAGGKLTFSHDGSRTVTVAYPTWGGLQIRGLTSGRLTNVTLSRQILTMTVNGSGSGTLYVNCTGRIAPQSTTGFTDTWYMPSTSLFWGTYTPNRTLKVNYATSAAGGGGLTLINVKLAAAQAEAVQGGQADVNLTLTWTGTPALTVQSITADWLTPPPMPIQLTSTQPIKTATIPATVTPPPDAPPGTHTIPIQINLQTAGYANIHTQATLNLNVKPAPTPQPAQGPIPTAVGIILGLSLATAITLALWKRR